MAERDLDDFDNALRAALRDDAARVLTPPVATVLARGRHRQRRRAGTLALGVVAVVLLAVGVVPGAGGSVPERLAGGPSPLVLMEGTDGPGPWRLEWTASDRCLTFVHSNGEGGGCGLADPAALSETTVRAVGDGDVPDTLVAGLAPDGAQTVTVTPDGDAPPRTVQTVRSGDATLFVMRFSGAVGVRGITAQDADDEVVGAFDGPAMPPPIVPGQVFGGYAPGARGYVEAPWAVRSVSEDRRSLDVAIYAVAGGCTGPEDVQALDMPEGLRLVVQVEVPLPAPAPGSCPPGLLVRDVTVELPRPLGVGEPMVGECLVEGDPAPGGPCSTLREVLSANG